LREINSRLLEGLECKDLITQKNKEIQKIDSSFSVVQKINVNLNKEIAAHEKNESNYKAELSKTDSTMTKLSKENTKLKSSEERQKRNKKTWCGIALGEAGLIVIVIITIVLL